MQYSLIMMDEAAQRKIYFLIILDEAATKKKLMGKLIHLGEKNYVAPSYRRWRTTPSLLLWYHGAGPSKPGPLIPCESR